jgi:hypothetical protein
MSQREQSLQPIAISSCLAQGLSNEFSIDKNRRGSHEERLFDLVSFVEAILFVRWQSLDDDPAHNDERLAMEAIADDLLAVKIHKLGWPDPSRVHNS